MPANNKQILQMIMQAFSKHNKEFVLSHLAEDIKWNIVGMPVIEGKNNFLNAMKMLELESFTSVNIKNIIAEGEYVVVESESCIKYNSGISDNTAHCDIYRFKDGKIHEVTTYAVDTAGSR